jgi:hypothetical protein
MSLLNIYEVQNSSYLRHIFFSDFLVFQYFFELFHRYNSVFKIVFISIVS